jgi:hypothetical protein
LALLGMRQPDSVVSQRPASPEPGLEQPQPAGKAEPAGKLADLAPLAAES